jgi:spore coat protein U-like protein
MDNFSANSVSSGHSYITPKPFWNHSIDLDDNHEPGSVHANMNANGSGVLQGEGLLNKKKRHFFRFKKYMPASDKIDYLLKADRKHQLKVMTLYYLALLMALLSLFFLYPLVAHAGEIITTVQTHAQVYGTCELSTSNLNFGTPTLGNTYNYSNATVNTHCTKNTPYTIALSYSNTVVSVAGGGNGNETIPLRSLRLNSSAQDNNYINYSIYQDAAMTREWGDGTTGSDGQATQVVNTSGTGSDQNFVTYGKLYTGTYVTPGDYSAVETVTVSY